MTSARELRAKLDVLFPATRYMPMDLAIGYVRAVRLNNAQYQRALDRAPGGRNDQDRCYNEWRDGR